MTDTNIPKSTGRPRKLDPEQGLITALNLFKRYGFEQVSIAMLCDELNIAPTSLYATYGNKESLFLRAFEIYQKQFFDGLESSLINAENSSHIFRITLEYSLEFYLSQQPKSACLILQGALFCKQQNIVENIIQQQQKLQQILQQRLTELGSQNAIELADVLLTLMRGLNLSVISTEDEEKLYTSLEVFCSAFDC